MSNREEEEEGFVNEFEEAYQQQDYARLAELIRFIRSEVRRDPKLANRVPTRELFELLSIEDAALAEELCWLLRDILGRVDVASILSTFGPALESMLRPSSRKEVLHLGLDFMEKAATTGNGSKGDLPTMQWRMLVELLLHTDVSVADRVAEIIISSSGELRDHLACEISQIDFSKSGNVNATVRVRILALRVKMNILGGGWDDLRELLKEATATNDPLLLMNALEITQGACTSAKTVENCCTSGVISQVKELVENQALESFLRAKAMMTLAAALRVPSAVATTVFSEVRPLEIINQVSETGDRSLTAAALLLFGVLCANEAIPDEPLQYLLRDTRLYRLIVDNDLHVQEAFQTIIAIIFTSTPSERQAVFYQQLSIAIASHPITLLIERAPSTLSEGLKFSTYKALSALLRHEWIVQDAVVATSLINFLLDRSSDRSTVGLQCKFDLIQQLAEVPSIEDTIKAQFRAYLAQGIAYSRAAPSIATQNR